MVDKKPLNPELLLKALCGEREKAFNVLFAHGTQVAEKALQVAERLSDRKPNLQFIREASILHDVGVLMTRSEDWGCNGNAPYIQHGVLGREILEQKGFSDHAKVCESHVGAGISIDDIQKNNLPLPLRDMLPETLEEEIICYADKFFSKNGKNGEKPLEQVLKNVAAYGQESLTRFQQWVERFEG